MEIEGVGGVTCRGSADMRDITGPTSVVSFE